MLRFEDFCARPGAAAREMLDFCGLGDAAGRVAAAAAAVSAPALRPAQPATADKVWREVAAVAERFGYQSGS